MPLGPHKAPQSRASRAPFWRSENQGLTSASPHWLRTAWVSYLTAWRLRLLICKPRIRTAPASWDGGRQERDKSCARARQMAQLAAAVAQQLSVFGLSQLQAPVGTAAHWTSRFLADSVALRALQRLCGPSGGLRAVLITVRPRGGGTCWSGSHTLQLRTSFLRGCNLP